MILPSAMHANEPLTPITELISWSVASMNSPNVRPVLDHPAKMRIAAAATRAGDPCYQARARSNDPASAKQGRADSSRIQRRAENFPVEASLIWRAAPPTKTTTAASFTIAVWNI
jgi:hypothetical protein